MAVTLSIPINDAEQAMVVKMAEVVAPGLTGPQLKAWAERTAKQLLREHILALYWREVQEDQNQARQAAQAQFDQAWPRPADPVESAP